MFLSSMRTSHWRHYRKFNNMKMVFPEQSPLRSSVWFNHIYLLASRFTQAVVLRYSSQSGLSSHDFNRGKCIDVFTSSELGRRALDGIVHGWLDYLLHLQSFSSHFGRPSTFVLSSRPDDSVERRAKEPIMPLRLFTCRTDVAAYFVGLS
jgi:hypothetical protein